MDKNAHNRKSIRLQGYDYSQAGLYFVTICTQNRESIFGEIKNGVMILNDFGEIIHDEWIKTEIMRNDINMGQFVIMPNHIHGIIEITRRGVLNTPHVLHTPDILNTSDKFHYDKNEAHGDTKRAYGNTPLRSPSQTVGAIVRGVKSAVTKQINELRQTPAIKLWQRNYYDHIIRNEKSYLEISEYIANNPLKWNEDKFNNEIP